MPGVATTVTTATDIWDAVWDRVQRLPSFHTYRRGPVMVQTQPEDLPLVACFMMEDDAAAVGDSNANGVKLMHSVRIGVSGVVLDSDSDSQQRKLATAVDALDTLLFTDPKFTTFDLIEGVERRRVRFNTYQVGELPVSEFTYELTVSVQNKWEPVIPDDFKRLFIKSGFPIDGTEQDVEATQQVYGVWEPEQ